MPNLPAKFTTKIIVTEIKHTHQGRTTSGGTYNLYQVLATKPDGTPVQFNLRSFSELPKHQVIEVDCELHRSERFGDSYTVQRRGGDDVNSKLKELEARIKKVEDFLSGRGEFGGSASEPAGPPPPPPPSPDQSPAAPPPPPPEPVALGQRDDDIPF